jgi:hypothetical protein
MIWVDLARDSLSVTTPEIYLVGEVVNRDWEAPVAAGRFMVDNSNGIVTITRELTTGYLRMHTWHKWHYYWWQHELVVRDGMIEFRGNGSALNPVKLPGRNTTIELDFRNGTGTIAQ